MSFDSISASMGSTLVEISPLSFIAPASRMMSLYWMNVGVEIMPYTKASVTINNSYLRIAQTHAQFDRADFISHSGLVQLEAGDKIAVTSLYNSTQAYWSAFRIDNIFDVLVAFYVASTKFLTVYGTVNYDRVIVNEGSAWDGVRNRFKAPYTDLYVFSFSAGITGNQPPSVNLVLNNITTIATVQLGAAVLFASGFVDLLSASCLLQLNASDTLEVQFVTNPIYSDATNLATSFSGFLYRPISGIQV